MADLDWWEQAACLGKGIRYFFPETSADLARARDICGGCPVRTECLHYSEQNPSPHGVWGGLTERERRGIRPRAA